MRKDYRGNYHRPYCKQALTCVSRSLCFRLSGTNLTWLSFFLLPWNSLQCWKPYWCNQLLLTSSPSHFSLASSPVPTNTSVYIHKTTSQITWLWGLQIVTRALKDSLMMAPSCNPSTQDWGRTSTVNSGPIWAQLCFRTTCTTEWGPSWIRTTERGVQRRKRAAQGHGCSQLHCLSSPSFLFMPDPLICFHWWEGSGCLTVWSLGYLCFCYSLPLATRHCLRIFKSTNTLCLLFRFSGMNVTSEFKQLIRKRCEIGLRLTGSLFPRLAAWD